MARGVQHNTRRMQRNMPERPGPEGRRVDPLLEVREKRRGKRLGDSYVRIVRPFEDEFERTDEGTLIASEKTILDRRGWHAAMRGHAIGHRAHHVFAYTAVHVGAAAVAGGEGLERALVRRGRFKIGAAHHAFRDHFGQQLIERG